MTCKKHCNDFKMIDDCCDYVPLPSFAVVDGTTVSLDLDGKNYDGISWTNNTGGTLTITNAPAYKSITLKTEAGSGTVSLNGKSLSIVNNISLLVVDSGSNSRLL